MDNAELIKKLDGYKGTFEETYDILKSVGLEPKQIAQVCYYFDSQNKNGKMPVERLIHLVNDVTDHKKTKKEKVEELKLNLVKFLVETPKPTSVEHTVQLDLLEEEEIDIKKLHQNSISKWEPELVKKQKRPVVAIKGETILYFESGMQAEAYGFTQANISACCKGRREYHQGFKWYYLEDYERMQKNKKR